MRRRWQRPSPCLEVHPKRALPPAGAGEGGEGRGVMSAADAAGPPQPPAAAFDDGMAPLREFVGSSQNRTRTFKCALDRGSVQVCNEFRQGFAGRGAERYETGEIYVGGFMAGERHGPGTLRHANGQFLVTGWKDNRPVGEGVQWSADHKKAARLNNGVPTGTCSLPEAGDISSRVGMPVPFSWFIES